MLIAAMGAVRILAGFSATSSREQYHIAREILDPPDELLQQVFPEVDEWLSKHLDIDNKANIEKSVTAIGTLRAIKYLRKVFLQDSVFLREKWPHLSAIWNHSLFSQPAYESYATQLKEACASPAVSNPAAFHIDPYTREYIDGHFTTLRTELTLLQHKLATGVASKDDINQCLQHQILLSQAWNASHSVPRYRIEFDPNNLAINPQLLVDHNLQTSQPSVSLASTGSSSEIFTNGRE
jgi:hypothetical protein